MVDDGVTTMKELMDTLNDAMNACSRHLLHDLPPKDGNGDYHSTYCKGEWDHLTCWPHSPPGQSVSVPCPEYIVDFDHTGKAYRQCGQDGNWANVKSSNKTWADYSGCHYAEEEDLVETIKNGDPKTKSLITLYTVGYSFSLAALVIAMCILTYFKRLHCTRNFIHMHLFVSFILRALVIFLKDRVLYHGSGILDVRTQNGEGIFDYNHSHLDDFPEQKKVYYIGCKLVMTLFHYFVATNYYWILVEALYLHSLLFVPFFSDKKYLRKFIVTGWGVPILFVVPWAIVRATLDDTACWDIAVSEYKWIYNGPIVVANVINFLLFLNIIRVLWYKMRKHGTVNRPDNRRQYKKLAKSTLILIPMFGVHAIVFIGMPDDIISGTWWDIRMNFDLFFNSFQAYCTYEWCVESNEANTEENIDLILEMGFFVAIIYCFCNGEVQSEFKKSWERFNLSAEIQRDRKDKSRSSLSIMTSINNSATQQVRPCNSGIANGCSATCPSNGTSRIKTNNYASSNGLNHTSSINFLRKKSDCETSFINKPGDNSKVNSQKAEELSLLSHRPSFIRSHSAMLPKGSELTLSIGDSKALEEAFESALEKQINCPAQSFTLADNEIDQTDCINNHSNLVNRTTEETDDIISGIETDELRRSRMLNSSRGESEDSGISSFYASFRSKKSKPTSPNDLSKNEGVADGGVSRNNDVQVPLDEHGDFNDELESENNNPEFIPLLGDVRESGV